MAKSSIQLKIISKNGIKFNGEIDSITLPSLTGEITILPNHIPLLSGLKEGDIKINGNGQSFAVASGFIRFFSNVCTVTIEELNIKKAI